jgi:predicted transposase/invertase (TIGR01784 family)
MKTDSLFYSIFLDFPQFFFELIKENPLKANNYEFTSREVKQLSFRIDGLFLPKNDDNTQPFYLVEVQFQPDEDLYYRLFAELFLYLKQYQPPYSWRIVVFYPSRKIERINCQHFETLLNLTEIQRIYLDELPDDDRSLAVEIVKLIVEPKLGAIAKTKSLITQTQNEIKETINQSKLLDLIKTIILYKLPEKSREEIEKMFSLSDLKKTKFYQEAFSEGEENTKIASINRMLNLGLSVEMIANYLDLPLKFVQEQANKNQNN